MKKLESSLKRTINWNKYQSKDEGKEENRYFDYFINPSFKGDDYTTGYLQDYP